MEVENSGGLTGQQRMQTRKERSFLFVTAGLVQTYSPPAIQIEVLSADRT